MLRKLFFLRHIYFGQTGIQIFIHLSAVVFGAFIIFGDNGLAEGSDYWALAIIILLWATYGLFVLRMFVRYTIIRKRLKMSTAATVLNPQIPLKEKNTAIDDELNLIDEARVIEKQGDFVIYDAVFNFYRKTRLGEYVAKQAYYTVFEMKLDRQLPHIIFDSRHAKRRQFQYKYLKSQHLKLEGNFAANFDAYVPQTYHIDMMSFITPEVMHAMLAAKDYDIEILHDKLLLYAPLSDADQLKKLKSSGLDIARHLNDNIDNYRDDRLTGEARKQEVTFFGKALLKNPLASLPWVIISGFGIAVITYWAFREPRLAQGILTNQISFLLYVVFFSSLGSMIKVHLENKRKQEQFNSGMHHTETARSKTVAHE